MEHLVILSLCVLLLIFLNRNIKRIEGYTSCNKRPSIQLFSIHFNHQFNELSILSDIDLANRAYKINIPLQTIKQLIKKDKQQLIYMIMLKEKTLFDIKQELESRKNIKEKKEKTKYVVREITGYNFV